MEETTEYIIGAGLLEATHTSYGTEGYTVTP
jgi:hypothetical protein